MTSTQQAVINIAAGLRHRSEEEAATLDATRQFALHLFDALEYIVGELVKSSAPGVTAVRRTKAVAAGQLRFGWGDTDLVFTVADKVALHPESKLSRTEKLYGRVLMFRTESGEEFDGRVLREYFVSSDGRWSAEGVGFPAANASPLDVSLAREHAIDLLSFLLDNSINRWNPREQIRNLGLSKIRDVGFRP